MKTSLFYKSHQADFPWLEYSRESVRKFVSGFDEIVLCLPEGQTFDWPEAKIVHVRETFNPYGFQQLCKLYADTWCMGDLICYQDSDTVWSRPTKPSDLMIGGKPFWPIRPFGDARSDQQIWRDVIRKYMKEEPVYEGMARHPFMLTRKSLQKLRAHCELEHDCSLGDYIAREFNGTKGPVLNFSEFNVLSAFNLKYCRDDYHWIDLSKEQAPEACCWQGFSHGPPERLQQDIEKFKQILGISSLPDAIFNQPLPDKLHPENLPQHPWVETFPAGMGEVTPLDQALAIIAAEAAKSPLHKARLTKKIAALGKKQQEPQPKKKRGRPAKKKLPGTGGNSVAFGDTSPEAIEIATRNIIVGTRPA